MTKICTKCEIEKDISEFYFLKDRNNYRKRCKACCRLYYYNNQEKIKKSMKVYRLEHLDDINNYLIENHEKRLKLYKKYYYDNKKTILPKKREYQKNNKEKIKKWTKQYIKNKRTVDVNFKLRKNLSHRILKGLKRQNYYKTNKTIELIGCTINELKVYLEKLFTKNMSWDNYGYGNDKWNIDHIIPCSFFDLTIYSERKFCFHFTNLQPLWQIENLQKSDKII